MTCSTSQKVSGRARDRTQICSFLTTSLCGKLNYNPEIWMPKDTWPSTSRRPPITLREIILKVTIMIFLLGHWEQDCILGVNLSLTSGAYGRKHYWCKAGYQTKDEERSLKCSFVNKRWDLKPTLVSRSLYWLQLIGPWEINVFRGVFTQEIWASQNRTSCILCGRLTACQRRIR